MFTLMNESPGDCVFRRHHVHRAFRVGRFVVERAEQPAVLEGKQAADQFHQPAGRAKVAKIAFGGDDRDRRAAAPKTSAMACASSASRPPRAQAMRIDVADDRPA